MKRFSIIFLGALAIMMASCSKDVAEPSPSNPDAWKTDITLPVPVEFGSSSVLTKVGYINDMWENMPFGVFGFNRDAQSISLDRTQKDPNCLLNNAAATYKRDENGQLAFTLNAKAYYPMTNEKNFNFYVYYQPADETAVEKTPYVKDQKVYVPFVIGKEDVLYGSAKVTDEMEELVGRPGFNGAYVRAVRNNKGITDKSAYLPSVNLQHMTSALEFFIKTSSEGSQAVFENDGFYISSIALDDCPVNANLCVADFAEGSPAEGTFDTESVVRGVQYLYADKLDGTGQSNNLGYVPKANGEKLGYPIFIVPTSEKITGYITLGQNATREWSKIPFTLDPSVITNPEGDPIESFKAGKFYTITLNVHSPEVITITVTLEAWKDGFEGGNGYEVELG